MNDEWEEEQNSFNRTFMELKRLSFLFGWSEAESFNRTFMELKQAIRRLPRIGPSSFNRTFMELKQELVNIISRRIMF